MVHDIESFLDETCDPQVRGFLHRPVSPSGDALVLTHSAGGNCQSPLLVAVAEAFAEMGMTVLRCDLPFRQVRPQGPPGPGSAARDREGLRQAVTAMRKIVLGRVFLGGHSYGGRQATMLAAEDADVAAALLLLSYPLHPPRRPTELRTAHFPRLRVPSLFVTGTHDEFASIEEITSALELIPARTRLLVIAGAGHSLAKELPTVAARVAAAFREFIG
ncbi:MAG TPA: alpha/beta family hydrolase [Terriglobales bacterium]|nr:alpha/beta family hydrolase [Terriglobales bacterium]